MIKVLVVDDHDLVRMGIARMLADTEGIEVVGEAICGNSALNQAKKLNPDIILLDVNMPNMNGIDASKKLIQKAPNSKILAVSAISTEPYPSMLVKAGVHGYITKGVPVEDMIVAIKKIHAGGRYFSSEISESLASSLLHDHKSPFDLLSEREYQVAIMVASCQSTQQIADALFVSNKTVNTYRYRIFEKLGVDSDVKLTHLAIRYGLVNT